MGTLSVALGLLRLKELAKYRAYRLFCFSVLCACHWFFFVSVDHVNRDIYNSGTRSLSFGFCNSSQCRRKSWYLMGFGIAFVRHLTYWLPIVLVFL